LIIPRPPDGGALAGEAWWKEKGAANAAQAEQSFRTAIEISRKQNARSWELRATTSPERLLAKQGKRDEARAMLAEIYGWFTEGFDTADLKDATALLDRLSNLRKLATAFLPDNVIDTTYKSLFVIRLGATQRIW